MALWIRPAQTADLPAILRIYAPYITDYTYSFEYTIPSQAAFRERFERITAVFPWIVCCNDEHVVGYAYADAMASRAAYRWSVDMSIYIDRNFHGRGTGSALYTELEKILVQLGYCNAYALITEENLTSCRFHEKMGYTCRMLLPQCGFKMGRWLGVFWYDKRLREEEPAAFPGVWDGKLSDGRASLAL